MIGCAYCQRIHVEIALIRIGMHLHDPAMLEDSEHACIWGYEDWDRMSNGHEQTWIPICHPEETDIAYEKATGEVYVRCRRCTRMSMRFAVGA
jgi:hypothetical protein